jgi:iron complex outermembrane receptor protein
VNGCHLGSSRGPDGPRTLRVCLLALGFGSTVAAAAEVVEEIVVTGSVLHTAQGVGSGSAIGREEIELIRPTHAAEAFVRAPGVWITRGSEQEHLTAIRSPVFSGPGSCGEFQVLENGIPIRPAGFCNVNSLIEVATELADSVEVMRGAGGALFGGNAVHGVINVVTGNVDADAPARVSIEAGPYDFVQGRAAGVTALGAESLLGVSLLATHADGYRDATGRDEQKGVVGHRTKIGAFDAETVFSGTRLEQETGGFVIGYKAYEGSQRRTNPNPEAYRDAWSWRLSSRLSRPVAGGELAVTPYLRRSSMEFLQHFLPGKPLERNGQSSAGVQAALTGGEVVSWRAGLVGEWAEGELFEYQANPAEGSAFIRETRPVGVHYDYEVESALAAAYYDLRVPLADDWALVHGARIEYLHYDYDNRGLDGNTRDDGTPCGFGGCLYSRPADRDDAFTNFAGRLGLEWTGLDRLALYGLAASGFRPPQATELYRLQSGQSVADLDSQQVVSLETGIRGAGERAQYALALFAERTRDLVLRDASGFNVNGGRIESAGAELDLAVQPLPAHTLHLALSYARHQYAFDRVLGGGEIIEDGKDVDTAPRWIGSLQWAFEPRHGLLSEVEVVYLGEHYINAENTADYPGHTVVNWRGTWQARPRWRLFARVINLFDEEYADRADFAFGDYRYFPAMPLQVYAGFEVTL